MNKSIKLNTCEVCNKPIKECQCKTSAADFIEAIPDDKFKKILENLPKIKK